MLSKSGILSCSFNSSGVVSSSESFSSSDLFSSSLDSLSLWGISVCVYFVLSKLKLPVEKKFWVLS